MLPYDVLRQVTYDHMTQLEEDARLERLARRTQRHGQRTRRAELRMHSRRWASAHLLRALRS